ncbi:hypothetical protein, partial [Burkholderia sp. Cy-647]|uniref:hypothetical protein n=1 Tax=Burkholderia sp. Cy-647 TaxID=2608328 RepID=UPI001F03AB99
SSVATIAWHTLALGQKLGEGASGVIYRATRLSADHHPQQAVAAVAVPAVRASRPAAAASTRWTTIFRSESPRAETPEKMNPAFVRGFFLSAGFGLSGKPTRGCR